MKTELFIARRLKLGNNEKNASPSLNVAMVGIVLAIVIMILSVVIVMGFKKEITSKIYSLNSHIKVTNAALGLNDNFSTVDAHEVFNGILSDTTFAQQIQSMGLIAEKSAILKTDQDFQGIIYKGVDAGFDWTYLKSKLVAGRVPNMADTADNREIVVSQYMANRLQLQVNDRIFTYFFDNTVKMRRSIVVGIFSTDFDTFDKSYILGNISLLQSVNNWSPTTGNYVGINMNHVDALNEHAYKAYCDLALSSYNHHYPTLYRVSQTQQSNAAYFTWLKMLDMNVVIILVLMMIVSSFTLISALLMVVLERIKMVGLLKSLGATNRAIRRIFIYLTAKLIVKSIVVGNIVGIGLAIMQNQFHIIKLNAEAYYMSYVPIEINIPTLLLLNVGILLISYLTLIAPSHIISTIKPSATMKFD